MRTLAGTLALALLVSIPAAAQQAPAARKPAGPPKDRGFLALNGGIQAAAGTFTDTFAYQVNVEDASTQARYKSKATPLIDVSGGVHIWKKRVGVAVGFTRSSVSGSADTESQIPHPFFDNRDRQVSGEAGNLTRTEAAAHVSLYYLKTSGKWRVMVSAGPSRFSLEQEVVTGVTVDETFPYDTATFRSATTKTGKGTAVGFNVGTDVAWMFSRSFGAGALIRYTKGSVSFNVEDTHSVSTDAGGVQAGAGIRIKF